jgi:hypothetical protein
VIDAIAKTVAELTSQQDGIIRKQVIEQVALIPRSVRFAVVEPKRHHNAPHSPTAACLCAGFGKCACQCTSRRDTGNTRE